MRSCLIVLKFAFALLILALPVMAGAFDYKSWVPLLPAELGGLKKIGKHEGMNMEMNNEKWATLTQTYGDENTDKEISITIVCGTMAPQMQQFKSIPKMKMETDDQIMTNISVAGREGFLIFDKNEKSGYLMIPLGNQMLITLETENAADQDKLTAIATELPLDKFKCGEK
ncbi:MAG: hypothetical protein C4582_04985 [Desulfobacteraceae bacterium]|nr:MAG: hypothetical protein C4582_04985 [Desulfobacteraceae bacterium]